VDELVRGRTTLIIAHRLSTLQRVDEIVVFDHGLVVEHGDRADLAGTDGSRFRGLLDLALETGHDVQVHEVLAAHTLDTLDALDTGHIGPSEGATHAGPPTGGGAS
jgi:D-ribose pyranose/furanose isomerase RbsD